MNIAALKQHVESNGNEFKSYRHLCEVLEVKPKGSSSKKAQEKEMARYFVHSKGKGYRLIVNEIYDKPKVDYSGNKAYNGLIQLLLTDYFLDKRHVVASRNFLLFNVNVINSKYTHNRGRKEKYAEELEVDNDFVYDFFNTTDDTFKDAIETALRNLRYQSLILYSWEPIVVDYDDKHRVATLEERDMILKAEFEAKKQMDYKDYREIMFNPSKLKESREIQNEFLRENNIKIKLNYMGYNINILKEEIAKAQEKMIISYLDEAERNGYKNELNSMIMDRLLENAKNRRGIAIDTSQEASKYFRGTRANFNYIEIMKSIINDNISNEIKEDLTDEDIEMMMALSSDPYQNK